MLPNHSSAIDNLNNKTEFTSQTRIIEVRQIRKQLQQLIKTIYQLKTNLLLQDQEMKRFLSYFDNIKALSQQVDFKLTDIDMEGMNTLIRSLEQTLAESVLEKLPENITIPDNLSIEVIYQSCDDFLDKKAHAVQKIIRQFNDKGETIRQSGLKQLSEFLTQQQGFWEHVIRFFSPTYRRCIIQIEGKLRNQDQSSLKAVTEIANLLSQQKDNSYFWVRSRLDKIASSNRYGLFQASEVASTTEAKPEHEPELVF